MQEFARRTWIHNGKKRRTLQAPLLVYFVEMYAVKQTGADYSDETDFEAPLPH